MNAGSLSKRPLHFHGKKRAVRERRRENEVRKCLVCLSRICDACCSHGIQQNLYMLYTSKKSGHLAIKSQNTPGHFPILPILIKMTFQSRAGGSGLSHLQA